jgi:hypothetical protein
LVIVPCEDAPGALLFVAFFAVRLIVKTFPWEKAVWLFDAVPERGVASGGKERI